MTRPLRQPVLPSNGAPLPLTRDMMQVQQLLRARQRGVIAELRQLERQRRIIGELGLLAGGALAVSGVIAIAAAISLIVAFGLAS